MATVFIPKASILCFRTHDCFLAVIISSTCQTSACNDVRAFIRLLVTLRKQSEPYKKSIEVIE